MIPRILLTSVLVLPLAAADPSPPAPTSGASQIDAAIKRFEESMAREFAPVKFGLEGWRRVKMQAALGELIVLETKSAVPEDRLYAAWHVLSVGPRHALSRDIVKKADLTQPFDDKGRPAGDWTPPACRDREMIDKVEALRYPPFEAVAEAISNKSPQVKAFWRQESAGLRQLDSDLVAIAAKDGSLAGAVFPMLAYYHPEAKAVRDYFAGMGKPVPRQRVWFNPVDQWVLDHELAGVDCLTMKPRGGQQPVKGAAFAGHGDWDFPEYLRSCRFEGVGVVADATTLTVSDDRGHAVRLTISADKTRLQPLDGQPVETALQPTLGANLVPFQLEVRGRKVVVHVNGIPAGAATLSADCAFKHLAVDGGGLVVQQLRARFLAQNVDVIDEGEKPAAPPVKPVSPPEAPWLAARQQQLDKPVSFAFADTSVEEVAAMLSRLSGAAFTLDDSAQTLKDMPVTMSGKDLKLQTALEWLQRLTDLQAKPTENGFAFSWMK